MERRVALLIARGFFVLLAALIVTWLAMPSPIGSLAWIPSPAPALDGAYRINSRLAASETLYAGKVIGPEDIAFDKDGAVWSGLADGRIVRFDGDNVVDVINTGGRPLGLEFGADGFLYVADARKGLLRIDLEKKAIDVLVNTAEGYPMKCVNDVVIASDGTVYFTDSSAVWTLDQFTEDILDQRPTGRVLSYNPTTKTTTVLAREILFANGLALLPDESALIVAETGRYRLWKLWLRGDRRNLKEVIIENLPGFPDNLQLSPRGTLWVALYSSRKRLLDMIHPYPWFKDATASLPPSLRPKPSKWGFVVELTTDGVPVRSLQDPDGDKVPLISAAKERDGYLWLGNLDKPHLSRLKLEAADVAAP